ncbi:MAG: hypothetical protein JJV99_05285 [Colwellia sp.]|nr:hypothetical protein [Colwellia sp.]
MASTNEKKEVCIDGIFYAVKPNIKLALTSGARSLFSNKKPEIKACSKNIETLEESPPLRPKGVYIDGALYAVKPHIKSLFASKRKRLIPEIS